MKSFKFILLITLATCMINCSDDNKQHDSYEENIPKSPEELKEELKSIEKKNPLEYLSYSNVTLKPQEKLIKKETFFRAAVYEEDGALIEGNITNNATLAKYKDIVLQVIYYSRTETVIKKESFILYEYYNPNSIDYFSIKVYPPKEFEKFNIKIIDAKPA